MIIGELVRVSEVPVIRALKIQDLSSEVALQTMWPIEVEDIRLHGR